MNGLSLLENCISNHLTSMWKPKSWWTLRPESIHSICCFCHNSDFRPFPYEAHPSSVTNNKQKNNLRQNYEAIKKYQWVLRIEGWGTNRQNRTFLGQREIPCMMPFYMSYLCLNPQCTNSRVNHSANYELWMIMMCQCRFFNYKKCGTLVTDANK